MVDFSGEGKDVRMMCEIIVCVSILLFDIKDESVVVMMMLKGVSFMIASSRVSSVVVVAFVRVMLLIG